MLLQGLGSRVIFYQFNFSIKMLNNGIPVSISLSPTLQRENVASKEVRQEAFITPIATCYSNCDLYKFHLQNCLYILLT